MTIEIDALREKIARIQQELTEVSEALIRLPVAPQTNGNAERNPLAGIRFTDTEALKPIIDKAFAEMGIPLDGPAMPPEEIQQMMLEEGVSPEDNIISRAIIEAREE